MKMKSLLGVCFLMGLALACAPQKQKEPTLLEKAIDNAKQQIGLEIKAIQDSGKILNPVTIRKDGSVYYCNIEDWRSGFYPGNVWYLSMLTGDKSLQKVAQQYTENIRDAQFLTSHHDIGFIINSSFGNGMRFGGLTEYKDVMIQAAKSLMTRYREVPGVIQSWNAMKNWECPVIVDNMMNLELLFEVTRLTGDSLYYKAAVSHANRTLQEHFREDGSCYHVIDYSLEDGHVRNRNTHQGYSDESAWSRGQAWGIYGFTMAYRFTKDIRYLNQAIKTFNFMKNHKNMPEDGVPYWDMDAPDIPNEPRDASSAAIIASALYEISTYDVEDAYSYKEYADKIITSLSSPAYTAALGTNGNFIMMHSVSSKPHNGEVDYPLNYADYYYLEALYRKENLEK